jgi:hypothetical protein
MNLYRAFGLAAVAAVFLMSAPKAAAQTAPVTGTVSRNGVQVGEFTGEFEVSRFAAWRGKLYAIGTLTGELELANGATREVRRQVILPVDIEASGVTGEELIASGTEEIQVPPLEVNVLRLVLGPLDLNLLGLEISLNQVILNIDADPTGGLLGALLAALAGFGLGDILGFLGSLGVLADFLNLILALLG